MSQIFDLGLSFYFMQSRKISFRKLPKVFGHKIKTIRPTLKFETPFPQEEC